MNVFYQISNTSIQIEDEITPAIWVLMNSAVRQGYTLIATLIAVGNRDRKLILFSGSL